MASVSIEREKANEVKANLKTIDNQMTQAMGG